MKKLLLFALLYLAVCCQAQDRYTYGGGTNRSRGRIEIKGDVAVAQMVQKHVELNERVRTLPGYRIQVASLSGTTAKGRAFDMRDHFREQYPDVEAYVVYDEPNFKLKVGDFRTRLEAYLFLQQIRGEYPGTIIKDNIYPTKIDWDEMVPENEDELQ